MAVASVFGALLIGGWTAAGATAKDMIYWTNHFANTIAFTNLDGSGGFGTLNTMGATLNGPNGVTIDPSTGKIYWANNSVNKISFANLNGTGGGDLNTGSATETCHLGSRSTRPRERSSGRTRDPTRSPSRT